MSTRRDKLLLYCLGRKTTPYEAAEKWEKQKGTEFNMGPWYACKKQLLGEGLIIERKGKGREKPIEANIPKYLGNLFDDKDALAHIRLLVPEDLIQKYSKRVVDLAFERHPQILEWDGVLSLPIFVLLFTRIFSSPKYDSPWKALSTLLASTQTYDTSFFPFNEILNTFRSFLDTLTDSERNELSMPTRNTQEWKRIAKGLDPAAFFQSIPADLLKNIMIGIARSQKWQQVKLLDS